MNKGGNIFFPSPLLSVCFQFPLSQVFPKPTVLPWLSMLSKPGLHNKVTEHPCTNLFDCGSLSSHQFCTLILKRKPLTIIGF